MLLASCLTIQAPNNGADFVDAEQIPRHLCGYAGTCQALGGDGSDLTWSARSHIVLSEQSKCGGSSPQPSILQAFQTYSDQVSLGSVACRSRWSGEDSGVRACADWRPDCGYAYEGTVWSDI